MVPVPVELVPVALVAVMLIVTVLGLGTSVGALDVVVIAPHVPGQEELIAKSLVVAPPGELLTAVIAHELGAGDAAIVPIVCGLTIAEAAKFWFVITGTVIAVTV
jgi:hypothetical protein